MENENSASRYVQLEFKLNLGNNEIYLGYKGLIKDRETLATFALGYAFNF